MNINSELAAMGEPAASDLELELRTELDGFFDSIAAGDERGDFRPPVDSKLAGEYLEKTRILRFSCECAASLCDLSSDGSTGTSEVSHQHPDNATIYLPNPFPNDFKVVRCLGKGNFGEVWLADDLHLDKPVALKTLSVSQRSPLFAKKLIALKNEAKLLAKVDHPNVVRVYTWREKPDGALPRPAIRAGPVVCRST